MVIEVIAMVVVLGCCLAVLLWQPGEEPLRPDLEFNLGAVNDEGLFNGWDGLTSSERKRRLAIYQCRVLAQHAEQGREWLQERLRECAKG